MTHGGGQHFLVEHYEQKDDWMYERINELVDYKGVYGSAPATPIVLTKWGGPLW